MAEWFASGRIIDAILVLVALEALVLLGWRVARGRGPSPAMLLSNLASGAALMLAVRAALTDSHWTIVAGCLVAALVAHLSEMCLRFARPGSSDRDAPDQKPWRRPSFSRIRDKVRLGT